jgi:mRNA interferase MazF
VSLPHRGEVWLADLGMEGKIRPCVIMSVPLNDFDRVLFTLVPHTTSPRGSRFECSLAVRFLRPGAFNAQGMVTVTRPQLMQRLGALNARELGDVERIVEAWLGLSAH